MISWEGKAVAAALLPGFDCGDVGRLTSRTEQAHARRGRKLAGMYIECDRTQSASAIECWGPSPRPPPPPRCGQVLNFSRATAGFQLHSLQYFTTQSRSAIISPWPLFSPFVPPA